VVTELTEHPDVYKTYLAGDEGWTDDNAGWDRLIREMAQPGNWGCHVTLCAAANAYGRSVHVACVDATTRCVNTTDVPPTRTPATGDPVTVAYVGLNHYVAVVPLEDAASSESPAGNNAGHETSPALDPPTDKSPSRAPRTYKSRSGQNAGEKARTLACRLEPLLVNSKADSVFEDAVQRVHLVLMRATEAIGIVVRKDIEARVPQDKMLRLADPGLVYALFRAMTTGQRGVSTAKYAEQQQRVLHTSISSTALTQSWWQARG